MAAVPRHRRGRRDRWAGLLVLAGLVAFVGAVYAVVVLGIGALIGDERSPSLVLSVLATAAVALGFERVRARLGRLANRAVHGTPGSPYDLLRGFSETITGGYDDAEIPARMAKLLAEGTGAHWAQVWLNVGGRPTLSATWPSAYASVVDPPEPTASAGDASGPHRRALPVRHNGELLGVLRLEEYEHRPITSVAERLFANLATQAGLGLRAVRLRAELAHRLVELSERAEELRLSRLRLITTQDDERSKLERDIHDGAQQHLVAMTVNLRLARSLRRTAPQRAAELLGRQELAAHEAIETLKQLSRGIYPRRLVDEGLASALRAATATGPVRVTITERTARRPPADVEAALYFSGLEALQNAAKHADATHASVEIDVAADGQTSFTIEDDGRGFDPATAHSGAGLANILDRVDAIHGSLRLHSAPGEGTRLAISIPPSPPVARAS